MGSRDLNTNSFVTIGYQFQDISYIVYYIKKVIIPRFLIQIMNNREYFLDSKNTGNLKISKNF